MPLVNAFISQKGGVGKSSLARALATFAIRVGLTATIADLDVQQRTSTCWEKIRNRRGVTPAVEVHPFGDAVSAFASSVSDALLIFDTAGQINEDTSEVATRAQLLVQPTSPSADDLPLSVLVFQALERTGIPRERLVFALSRVLSDEEQLYARMYLTEAGYTVLKGSIPERIEYRQAMREGASLAETNEPLLKSRIEEVLTDLLDKAGEQGQKRSRSVIKYRLGSADPGSRVKPTLARIPRALCGFCEQKRTR